MKGPSLTADTKATSILVFRLVLFVIVLASGFLFLPLSSFLLTFFAVYGLFTLAFLLAVLFSERPGAQKWFWLVSFSQLFLEVFLEALLVHHSGGIKSPLAILFFLSIVSSSLSHQLVGTILVASWVSLTYSATVLFAAGWDLETIFTLQAVKGIYNLGDDYFYTLFIYLCSFYLVAFSSGYLAQRLKIKAELLLTASRQLRRVRMETDDILQHLHSGLITIDNTGRIVHFNQAAQEILQQQARQVQGKDCRAAFQARMPELLQELLNGLEYNRSESRKEIEVTDQQGKSVPIGISTSVLQDEDQNLAGVIALFQDLTQIKQLEEQLRTKDRLAAVGELSAGIAHEIRNPLASISGSVEVLKQELKLEGDNSNLMELIIKETQRLNRILTDFLNFARIKSVHRSKIDLVPVMEEIVDIVKNHPSYSASIVIDNQLPLHPIPVIGEENHLKQLFLNLLINALEAMEGKKGKIAIAETDSLKSRNTTSKLIVNEREWLGVSVTDQGKGMTQGQMQKMFLPFYSTKKQGTGLGLSIVQRLVDSLNGRIECRSTLGQGTTFQIWLPKFAEARDLEPQAKTGPVAIHANQLDHNTIARRG